jgi:hypothetical protein
MIALSYQVVIYILVKGYCYKFDMYNDTQCQCLILIGSGVVHTSRAGTDAMLVLLKKGSYHM